MKMHKTTYYSSSILLMTLIANFYDLNEYPEHGLNTQCNS